MHIQANEKEKERKRRESGGERKERGGKRREEEGGNPLKAELQTVVSHEIWVLGTES